VRALHARAADCSGARLARMRPLRDPARFAHLTPEGVPFPPEWAVTGGQQDFEKWPIPVGYRRVKAFHIEDEAGAAA